MDYATPPGDTAVACVRLLNDAARWHLTDGKVVLTRGIVALPEQDVAVILDRVRTFEDFKPDNDPWCEHDFGAFEHNGQHIFWKIDYYDREERYGSPDPADPTVTKRVLTVMLAGEY
jgi:hypothetical protein